MIFTVQEVFSSDNTVAEFLYLGVKMCVILREQCEQYKLLRKIFSH
jgi:hypothetical protein